MTDSYKEHIARQVERDQARRCEGIDPRSGNRCGNYKGHRGEHTVLMASPFFGLGAPEEKQ